jgi:Flp pilus assembly protein TadG
MRFWKTFRRDDSGVSAVEFALIAPVLLICLVGIYDIGMLVYKRTDMHSALRSGVQYFMNGGDDMAKAEDLVEQAWTTKPETVSVVAERFCLCGDEIHVCNALCDDETYPAAYKRLRAMATIEGILGDDDYSATQSIRVR